MLVTTHISHQIKLKKMCEICNVPGSQWDKRTHNKNCGKVEFLPATTKLGNYIHTHTYTDTQTHRALGAISRRSKVRCQL